MKIFFDLDGTLIHSGERLYRLFQHLVPASALSYDEYWTYKKNRIGHREILGNIFFYSHQEIDVFEKRWLEKIELPEWLALDTPIEAVTEHLLELKKRNDLYLVTARQFEQNLLTQLEGYGWSNIFCRIFVTCAVKEKAALIRENVIPSANDWFIGDTGMDIQTGKSLGMKTAAVLSGFLNKERLSEYEPDLIVENVTDLLFK